VCGTTAFSRNTAKYFDHVVYCQVSNKKHNFASSTTYANNVLTGSRTDVALEVNKIPTLLDIFAERSVAPVAPTLIAQVSVLDEFIAEEKKQEAIEATQEPEQRVPAAQVTPAAKAVTGLSAMLAARKLAAAQAVVTATTPPGGN